jgi:hypothetical protein
MMPSPRRRFFSRTSATFSYGTSEYKSAGSQEQDRIAHGGPELLWVIETRQNERPEVAYVRVVG